MTIEHGAIMEILATPSSSSSRSPSISWQACQNATCLCLCALRFWVGLLEMWSLQQASQKKKNISLFGWMLPSLKWNRCECCWLNLLVQCNSWAFPNQASIQQVSCDTLHTQQISTSMNPRTTTVLQSKMNQHPTSGIWWVKPVKPLRPNVRYIKWRNPHPIIEGNPHFQNSQQKTTGHAFEEPNFLWMNVGVLPSYPIQTTVNPYIRTTGQLITDFHGILHDFPGILHQFKRTFTSPILNPKFPDFRNVGKYLTFIFWGFPLNHTPGAF